MTKRREEVKRQLFKGLVAHTESSSSLDATTSNLLSRTLRKESDKYRRPSADSTVDEPQFVIHKSTSPEDYKIFSSKHPLRDSRLQALATAEATFDELFHRNGADDSGSEDDEPDLSNIASPSHIQKDDILISVPGYSREEVTASKRLAINDRKNVRLSKVSALERGFAHTDFLKKMNSSKLRDYSEMNHEYNEKVDILKEEARIRKHHAQRLVDSFPEDPENIERYHEARLELLREAVDGIQEEDWKFQGSKYVRS